MKNLWDIEMAVRRADESATTVAEELAGLRAALIVIAGTLPSESKALVEAALRIGRSAQRDQNSA